MTTERVLPPERLTPRQDLEMRMTGHLPRALLLLTLVGCEDEPTSPAACMAAGTCTEVEARYVWEVPPSFPVDTVLVVDPAAVADDRALHLQEGLRNFGLVMEEGSWRWDPRVALIVGRATVGEAAPAPAPLPLWPRAGSDCGATTDGEFLRTGRFCGNAANFSGRLSDQLACSVAPTITAPVAIPSQPEPLAVLRALSRGDVRPQLAQFLRPAAALVVVVVSAGDDRSNQEGLAGVEGPPAVARALLSLKDDPARVFVRAVVVPESGGLDTTAGCLSDGDPAQAAPRLTAFVQSVPDGGIVTGNCAAAWGPVLRSGLPRPLGNTLGLQCLYPPAGTRQVECVVQESPPGSGNDPSAGTVIPPCSAGERKPCWTAEADPSCSNGPLLEVQGSCSPAPGTLLRAACTFIR